jgi:basic membrane lipoprotein Med (substrate-binding protein (PBP1-ABC) superfamily)/DNA-binding SARP family transcriptional activator
VRFSRVPSDLVDEAGLVECGRRVAAVAAEWLVVGHGPADTWSGGQANGKLAASARRKANLTVRVWLTERISIEASGVVVDEQRFPGRQGRLVFAYLLAARGRPVPTDELADALWGDHPPARWEKALSVLVSKLRALLTECGVDGASSLTSAFGCYTLTLPAGAWIDVDEAADAVERAEVALATGDLDEARSQASTAAKLARRSFLPGEDGSWIEEQRRDLRGVLVRALECSGDASLAAGEFAEAVRHAAEVTGLERFRESSYRRLMEAHAAAGNPAEALRVYERCRRFLADELGAYPSPETESLYRELLSVRSAEPDRAPPHVAPRAPLEPQREAEPSRPVEPIARAAWRRRGPILAALVLSGAITLAATVALGGASKSPPQVAATRPQVALVIPRAPRPDRADTYVTSLVDGLRLAERELGVHGEIFVLDERNPTSPAARRTVERVRTGRFDLAIAANITIAQPFGQVTLPGTRWVVLDSPVDVPYATGFLFEDRQAGFLAGYLSGLMERTKGPRLNRAHAVSMIGGLPGGPVGELLAGFEDGARRALPDVAVYRSYSRDFVDQSKCAAIANRHIDRGADIVFAAAGTCSLGALSAAGLRGVWAVGVDSDRSHLGPHILASAVKRHDQAILIAVRSFLSRTLPGGKTLTLGLDADAVGLVGLSPSVPDSIRRKVASMAAGLRKAHGPT